MFLLQIFNQGFCNWSLCFASIVINHAHNKVWEAGKILADFQPIKGEQGLEMWLSGRVLVHHAQGSRFKPKTTQEKKNSKEVPFSEFKKPCPPGHVVHTCNPGLHLVDFLDYTKAQRREDCCKAEA